MGRSSPIRGILRNAGLPAVALIIMGAFAYNAVLGPNGLMAYKEFREQVEAKSVKLADLDKRRAQVRNNVDLLDKTKGADPDLVNELLYKRLNVVSGDDLILVEKKK